MTISAHTPILEHLRADTAGLHRRIEGTLTIARPDVTVDEYARWLDTTWGFYAALEPLLVDRIDAARLTKTQLLARDLVALDRAPQRLCGEPPNVASEGRALGCMYVVEGSTLGGRVLEARLRDRMPDTIDVAGAYLRCYGERTREMWRALIDQLETRAAASDVVAADMRAGAVDTFEAMLRWHT